MDTCEYVKDIEKSLRKIDAIVRKNGRNILNNFDITIPQFTALQIIIKNGDMTIGELSKEMSLASSTITDLIDRMEKSELVVRKKDIKDKRIIRINVLPKGNDVLEKVLEKRIEFLGSKLTSLNEDEKNLLNQSLTKLYESMKE